MRLTDVLDELRIRYRTTLEQADRLEHSILRGHIKRPISHVEQILRSFPAFLAACMVVRTVEDWRDRLPPEFIAECERDR